MKKIHIVRTSAIAALLLSVYFSASECHLAYYEAMIEQPHQYVALLLAAYLTLFARIVNQNGPLTVKDKKVLWIVRVIIFALLLIPHLVHGLHVPLSAVSSATIIDTTTVIALVKVCVPEFLIHILTDRNDPPAGGEHKAPKNDELVH